MNKSGLKIAVALMSILALLGAGVIAVGLIFRIDMLAYVGYAVFMVGILFVVMFAGMLAHKSKEVYSSTKKDK